MKRVPGVVALLLATPLSMASAQATPPEEIAIVRSFRLTRQTPTAYCAEARTSYPRTIFEDTYDFKAVATAAPTGRVTSASGPVVGTLHACFGASPDSTSTTFYAEGTLYATPFVGHGSCLTTRRDFPEPGIRVLTCHLDLTGLPAGYVGGQLTTNSITSRQVLGGDSDPPGYTQPSIATVRLWRARRLSSGPTAATVLQRALAERRTQTLLRRRLGDVRVRRLVRLADSLAAAPLAEFPPSWELRRLAFVADSFAVLSGDQQPDGVYWLRALLQAPSRERPPASATSTTVDNQRLQRDLVAAESLYAQLNTRLEHPESLGSIPDVRILDYAGGDSTSRPLLGAGWRVVHDALRAAGLRPADLRH